MIFLEAVADIIDGILDALGGYHWLFARRYIMPVLTGIFVSVVTHVFWMGALSLGAIGTLTIGYGENSWLYKTFSDSGGRAVWMLIQALAMATGVLVLKHLAWYFYVPYILVAAFLGFAYVSQKWTQKVGDFITGSWLGMFLLFLH